MKSFAAMLMIVLLLPTILSKPIDASLAPSSGVKSPFVQNSNIQFLAGDWSHLGKDKLAFRIGNRIYRDINGDFTITNNEGLITFSIQYPSDRNRLNLGQYVAGDFDGDGVDSIGVRIENRLFISNDCGSMAAGCIKIFGNTPWNTFLIGDWDGPDVGGKKTGILIVEPSGSLEIDNDLDTGSDTFPNPVPFPFPPDSRFKFYSGDWDGGGKDEIAVYDPSTNVIYFYNKIDGSDVAIKQLPDIWRQGTILAGDFNGDNKDEIVLLLGV